jgi:drug/metabolite transporter (DMT)-like permease
MRGINEITLSAYILITMLLVYTPYFAYTKGYLSILNFDTIDWLLCVLLGFTSLFMQVVRALSVKYEEPAKVAVLNYFQPIIQLILDLIFLNSEFSK